MTSAELDIINQAYPILQREDESIRQCDVCNKYMIKGYLHDDSYYCSDKCLHTEISAKEWAKIDHENSDDSYWTEWGELTDVSLEDKQREELVCIACKEEKDKGLVVCWNCFKYVKNPFKTSGLSLEEWLVKKGIQC